MANFDLTAEERSTIMSEVTKALEEVYQYPRDRVVAPVLNAHEVKRFVRDLSFDPSEDPITTVTKVISGLKQYAVHTHHPGYFGLFNSRPNYVSAVADYITAMMNPQMAAWSHAPFANEVERRVIEEFGRKFGYTDPDGTFCGGGAESNLTAVQCALNNHFPDVSTLGVLAITRRPIIYCSSESHHSIVKAARTIGLGSDSVRTINVNSDLTMDLAHLRQEIDKDLTTGDQPMMVVATAGTTGSGAIDEIDNIADIVAHHRIWLHVDGAYGAAVIVSREHRGLLRGIERSDSITIDFHKWFSVPMGASAFITRSPEILFQTYNIQTGYMPPDGDQVTQVDPYLHSIQWSRRFIGLKIFMSMVIHGWEGYEQMIDRDIAMGVILRDMLLKSGWEIINDAVIPVICFTHPDLMDNNALVKGVVDSVVEAGDSWISIYPIQGKSTIRACVCNYATSEEDLKILVGALNTALRKFSNR